MDQAIIYVVDSCDVDRVATSKDEFHAILEEEEVKDALILVYANKQVSNCVHILKRRELTFRICLAHWMMHKLQRDWDCIKSRIEIGQFSRPLPSKEKESLRDWTGCQACSNDRTRN